ncbi:MAG: MopE-related protein [Pseudomonadota bacterium]|nr:MopE-related protein [Pseudomonadota bacterium]
MPLLTLLLACTAGEVGPSPVDADGDGAWSAEDCDDGDPTVFPGAPDDACDGVDQDCDGHADDASPDLRVWYVDADGDGFGGQAGAIVACEAPDGATTDFRDCDDTDAAVFPGAPEDTCDGVDSDCDGDFDEDAPEVTPFYVDADGDGYGDGYGDPVLGCTAPAGTVASDEDCDDDAADARPGGTEVCGDGLDNDCDGLTDLGCGGNVVLDLDALPRLVGESPDQVLFSSLPYIGMSLAMGGDTDGDGNGELVIGLPHAHPNGAYSGRIYLMEGIPSGESTFGDAGQRIEGADAESLAGEAVAFLRDSDGDGLDELLVGAPRWEGAARGLGMVYVLDRPAEVSSLADVSTHLFGSTPSGYAGSAVADAGTVLGTGSAIAVGAPSVQDHRGVVYVLAAPRVGEVDLAEADALLVGEADQLCAGEALARAGDVDGDGLDDLVIGASGACNYDRPDGAAWIVHGPLRGTLDLADADARITGEAGSAGSAGQAVAGPGDLDGDGLADVAITAPNLLTSRGGYGVVYLYTGGTSGTIAAADAPTRLDASGLDGGVGVSVAGAGDIDADGRPDLIVGVGYSWAGRTYSGTAYVVTTITPGALDVHEVSSRILDRGSAYSAGSVVTGGTDLDGDGVPDLAIGGVGITEFETIDSYLGAVFLASPGGWF